MRAHWLERAGGTGPRNFASSCLLVCSVFLEQSDDFGVASLLCPLPSSPITAALRINICSVVEKKFYDIGVARPCCTMQGRVAGFQLSLYMSTRGDQQLHNIFVSACQPATFILRRARSQILNPYCRKELSLRHPRYDVSATLRSLSGQLFGFPV